MHHDLIVIGGGPGGYAAAVRAAQLGAGVALIEKGHLGGTCLNRGCIPTKSLYRNAQFLYELADRETFGVAFDNLSFDIAKAHARKDKTIEDLRNGISQLLKSEKVERVSGRAEFLGSRSVRVYDDTLGVSERTAERILIAAGSKAARPPLPGVDLPGVITSDEALNLTAVPGSMIIIGGGVIGIEFAGILAAFGTDVTVLEFLPRILAGFDGEMAKRLALFLKKKGIRIDTGIAIENISQGADARLLVAGSGKEFSAETVLCATGRSIETDGLNLEAAGIEYDRKGIKVDSNFESSAPGVFAIGDIIGGKMLAHVATEQGKACVEAIYGSKPGSKARPLGAIPSCVFTFPELASAGASEEELQAAAIPYKIAKSNFRANGKALTLGESDGFVKLIYDPGTGLILGTHIVGPHADDLIQEAVLAMDRGIHVHELAEVVHAHPGLPEAFHDTILAASLSMASGNQ